MRNRRTISPPAGPGSKRRRPSLRKSPWKSRSQSRKKGSQSLPPQPRPEKKPTEPTPKPEQKPVEPAPTPEKKPAGTDPAFDPTDLERTLKWMDKVTEKLRKERQSNGIRYRAGVEKFNDDARSYAGTKVRWDMKVDSISETDVDLSTSRGGRVKLKVGDGISKEKAARLNRGEKITVTAEVTEIRIAAEGTLVSINVKNERAE
jgi:hypothetical protein